MMSLEQSIKLKFTKFSKNDNNNLIISITPSNGSKSIVTSKQLHVSLYILNKLFV